jgi:hypothetical protein
LIAGATAAIEIHAVITVDEDILVATIIIASIIAITVQIIVAVLFVLFQLPLHCL